MEIFLLKDRTTETYKLNYQKLSGMIAQNLLGHLWYM